MRACSTRVAYTALFMWPSASMSRKRTVSRWTNVTRLTLARRTRRSVPPRARASGRRASCPYGCGPTRWCRRRSPRRAEKSGLRRSPWRRRPRAGSEARIAAPERKVAFADAVLDEEPVVQPRDLDPRPARGERSPPSARPRSLRCTSRRSLLDHRQHPAGEVADVDELHRPLRRAGRDHRAAARDSPRPVHVTVVGSCGPTMKPGRRRARSPNTSVAARSHSAFSGP